LPSASVVTIRCRSHQVPPGALYPGTPLETVFQFTMIFTPGMPAPVSASTTRPVFSIVSSRSLTWRAGAP
jgi:hypothetical protein